MKKTSKATTLRKRSTRNERPVTPVVLKPKHALHIKIMRMTDGSCIHLTSVCTITTTSSGKLERTVIQNVQDRANHPRWSGISTATDVNPKDSRISTSIIAPAA